jgi:hypothetical protein
MGLVVYSSSDLYEKSVPGCGRLFRIRDPHTRPHPVFFGARMWTWIIALASFASFRAGLKRSNAERRYHVTTGFTPLLAFAAPWMFVSGIISSELGTGFNVQYSTNIISPSALTCDFSRSNLPVAFRF